MKYTVIVLLCFTLANLCTVLSESGVLCAQSDKLDIGFSGDGIGSYLLVADYFYRDALIDTNNDLVYFLNEPEAEPVTHYMLRVLSDGSPDISLGPVGIMELPDFNIDDPCDVAFEEACHTTTRIVRSHALPDGRMLLGGESKDFDPMFSTWFLAMLLPVKNHRPAIHKFSLPLQILFLQWYFPIANFRHDLFS